jgi:serine/threonine protein kinase
MSVPLTGAGTILGTLQYMSPEQLEGKEADARSDIFAFGLVFYELLTGKRAFDAGSQASLIAAILKEQPKPVSEIHPVTPKAIDRIIGTSLEKDPEKRWQSAREIRHALDWALADSSISAPAALSAAAPFRRARVWQFVAVISLLIAAALGGWSLVPKPVAPRSPVRFEVGSPANARLEEKLLAYRDSQSTASGDIWVMDLARGVSTRLTFDRGLGGFPVWSPDGRSIAYNTGFNLYQKAASGAGEPELLLKSNPQAIPSAWSNDGRVFFSQQGDIKTISVADRTVSTWLGTAFIEAQPAVSPDGRWVAYTSNESGTQEIFVRPSRLSSDGKSPTGKWQVSRDGGSVPRWRGDGKELFYREPLTSAPVAVDIVSTAETFHTGIPHRLFALSNPTSIWTVANDGRRFLMVLPPQAAENAPIQVVLNWASALNR